jgi:GDSL-like Lipase/Acylhydrolase family
MKLALPVIAVCLMCASLNHEASAQSAVTLTQEDSQGFFWDAGNSQRGQTALQLYQAFVPNEPSQAFTWTPVSGGFKVCSLSICLSDNGTGSVVMSAQADVFTITNQSAVLDVSTGRYVNQASSVGNGSALSMGTTPQAWTFALAGASSATGVGATSGVGTTTGTGTASGAASSTGGQIAIMPLGDSITEGFATADTFAQGGYRCPLYSMLQSANVQFTFVGDSASLEPGVVTQCPDVDWEGHGGYDIASVQGWEDNDGSVTAYKPNYILLLGGTNDVAQGEPSSVASQLSTLLSDLFAKDPNAWIIISTIPPMNPSASDAPSQVASWAPQVPQANTQIKAVAAQFPRTTLIDFYSAAVGNVSANIGTDGVHPTVTGYGILANLWYQAIAAQLAK